MPAGWYGKLPALGDFAQRRLPADFVALWDAWLQRVILESRQQLGEAWLPRYLSAPVWRFVLAQGVAGPGAWGGLLLPSVDRVGRYFPLTVCAPLPHWGWSAPETTALDAWMDRLEDAVRACLSHDATLDGFEADLARAGLPVVSPAPGARGAAAAALLGRRAAFPLAQAPGQPPAFEELARAALEGLIAGYTLWWRKDGSVARAFAHLPPGPAYAALLDDLPAAGETRPT